MSNWILSLNIYCFLLEFFFTFLDGDDGVGGDFSVIGDDSEGDESVDGGDDGDGDDSGVRDSAASNGSGCGPDSSLLTALHPSIPH